jgi:hypothetical protein
MSVGVMWSHYVFVLFPTDEVPDKCREPQRAVITNIELVSSRIDIRPAQSEAPIFILCDDSVIEIPWKIHRGDYWHEFAQSKRIYK